MKKLTIILLVLLAVPLWAGEYDEAVKLIKAKKYSVAKTLLEATLRKDKSPKVYYALGYCHEKAGAKEKAIECYRNAVAQNLNTRADAPQAALALKKLMELKPEIGTVLGVAQDLEDRADAEKSEFIRRAAKRLYAYALDPANWDLKKPEKTKPIVNVGVTKRIPRDALRFNGNRYKTYVSSRPLSWEAAKKKCEALGGHLVTIDTKGELELVTTKLIRDETYLWLGGYRDGKVWKWADGSKFSFSKWARGTDPLHPDVWCMGLRPRTEGKGVTAGKNTNEKFKGYICEWE